MAAPGAYATRSRTKTMGTKREEDRSAREVSEREAQAAKDSANREERMHDRELKAEIEKAGLTAEDERMTRLYGTMSQQ